MKIKHLLVEGGNLSLPTGEAEQINLQVTDRGYIVPILNQLINAINQSFAKVYKQPLWSAEVLKSQTFLSGSSLHFFNVKGISDKVFVEKKPKVGDIDTMVDKTLEPQLEQFLTSIQGKQIGPATFLGFQRGNEQFSSLWELQDPPIKIQIDLEFVEYEKGQPTDWARFSHSSSWDDLQNGVKGVFHKFLIQSLAALTKREFLLRKLVGRGALRKEEDVPTTDNMFSFAVSSKEGGGLRAKYEPVLDTDTNTPLVIDGLPVMKASPPSGYERNIGKIFASLLGKRISPKESAAIAQQFWSFSGLISVLSKILTPQEKQTILVSFLDKTIGSGAQGLYKNNPDRDIAEKAIAINLLIQVLGIPVPNNLEQLKKIYQSSYKMTAVNEAEVVSSKRKGIVHLEKMKDLDFLDLLEELRDETGKKFSLDSIPMNVKVDGMGGRFGKDAEGKPFFESSSSGPIQTPGAFTAFQQNRGVTDPTQLQRAANYDKLFDQVMQMIPAIDKKFGKDYLNDVKVHTEVLYSPMAEEIDGKLKFIHIEYNKLPEGVTLALVPLFAEVATTGEEHPESREIIEKLRDVGQITKSTMFIDNSLTTDGSLDVTAIIKPLQNLDELREMILSNKRIAKQEANEAIQPIKDELAKEIINNPKIFGKDILGTDYEGVILNTSKGPVKVTSPKFKEIMAAKRVQQSATISGTKTGRTAVVTAGSFVGHRGHEQLVNLVLDKAKQVGGDPYVYISSSTGTDDPIPAEVKLKTWQKLYPQQANMFQVIQPGGSVAKKIEKELITASNPPPYDHIIVMVGTDRYEGFKSWMEHLSSRMKDPRFPGFEHVTIDVENTPREMEAGGTGISFTQLRNILKNPNASEEQKLALWMKGFDGKKLGGEWIKYLMDLASQNMGLSQQQAIKEYIEKIKPMLDYATPEQKVKIFKQLSEAKKRLVEGAPIVVAQAHIHIRNPQKNSQQEKPPTAYQQGIAAQGKPYKNPYPFDPKAGSEANYDHNQYRAGYKKQGIAESNIPKSTDYLEEK